MRRLVLVIAAAIAAVYAAPAAEASCAPAPPLRESLAEAHIAFVGTVVALDHDGRTATFRVEDVWKGVVPETVVVHAGPGIDAIEDAAAKGQGVASSVDRTYTAGSRYLVLPFGRSGDVLRDSICSNTQRYSDDLAGLRPASAHPPLAGGTEPEAPTSTGDAGGGSSWILPAGLAAAGAALAGAFAWLRARGRRTAPS